MKKTDMKKTDMKKTDMKKTDMKKTDMKKIAIGIIVVTASVWGTAYADSTPASGDRSHQAGAGEQQRHHRANIDNRIKQGMRSGELNKEETKRLIAERRGLRSSIAAAREDGIDREEAIALREQRRAFSRDVYMQKHDKERRGTKR